MRSTSSKCAMGCADPDRKPPVVWLARAFSTRLLNPAIPAKYFFVSFFHEKRLTRVPGLCLAPAEQRIRARPDRGGHTAILAGLIVGCALYEAHPGDRERIEEALGDCFSYKPYRPRAELLQILAHTAGLMLRVNISFTNISGASSSQAAQRPHHVGLQRIIRLAMGHLLKKIKDLDVSRVRERLPLLATAGLASFLPTSASMLSLTSLSQRLGESEARLAPLLDPLHPKPHASVDEAVCNTSMSDPSTHFLAHTDERIIQPTA